MSEQDLMTLYKATPAHTFFTFSEWVDFVGDVTDIWEVMSWFKTTNKTTH